MFAAGFLGPYSLYQILSYLANPEAAILHPYVWIAVMILGRVIRLAASQKHSFALSRMTSRIKAALSAEMYDRLLSSKELSDNFLATPVSDPQAQVPTASGQLTNLLSSDLSIISMAGPSIMILVGVPVGIILGVFGLYKVIGWPSFVGILIIIICIPLPSWIIKNVGGLQMSAREAQDSRLSLASEYFGALRLIKYFAWEQYVEDRINQSRKEEQKHLWKIEAMFVVMGEVTELIPVVALLAIFLLHTVILHQPLTAAVAFTTISLMTTLKAHLNLLGIIAPRLTNASISFKRLDKFFETTEPRAAVPTGPLRIKDATILRGSKNPFKLHNVSAEFVQGGLNVVSGSTGSGKTTLLLALLGETELQQGAVYCPAEVAYASQVPWIQPRTVKENIVFDAPFNESRYAEVIRACHLTVDIDSLAEGDATVLDESGSNLSVVLDDPFSALDGKTARGIWEDVFCSKFARDRTIVLVTQLPWILSQADLVVILKNGTISSVEQNIGVVRTAKVAAPDGGSKQPSESGSQSNGLDSQADGGMTGPDEAKASGSDEMAATGITGRLKVLSYMLYFGGPPAVILTLLSVIAFNGIVMAATWWLSYWVDSAPGAEARNVAFYLGIYVGLRLGSSLLHGVSMLLFISGAWNAAKKLHNSLLFAVLRVSLDWHSKTPVGRILNRVSGDVDILDQSLGAQVAGFLDELTRLLFQIGTVSSIFPIFLLPAAVASVLGFLCGELYSRAAVSTQRLVSSSQSPILSQFSKTFAGLATIRSQRHQIKASKETLYQLLQASMRAALVHKDLDCWLQFRIDALTSSVSVIVAYMAIEKVGVIGAGLAGFSLANANGLSVSILNMVGIMNDMDIDHQSFHRVEEYCCLPPEEAAEKEDQSAARAEWPSSGRVEYRNVTIRYDEDGADILTGVNVTVEPGTRVALVGRTGSGKSTLLMSLLGFTKVVAGSILVDGVDIATIPKARLRSRISTIPQEAHLFQGTVQSNLDLSGKATEEVLQARLQQCMPAERGSSVRENGLSTSVNSNGSNFSLGERQLLSLCRALVRNSKLMLLDEATASMDAETDKQMQEVLGGELSGEANGGRSLFTIAHRLSTIADYDKVIVLDAGKVVETGSPARLFAQGGLFHEMVTRSGDQALIDGLSSSG
ncbi:hypothetical protein K4F52_007341 [Lecanicillium sp. MT-2017a]|nr:hypothetical protein K4F52_007341 [Lecanicillium sp. MT-2017a]